MEERRSSNPLGVPDGFEEVAVRLHAGRTPLQIRDELMAEQDLSRLAAGKRVEATQKFLRAGRVAFIGGAASLLVTSALLLFGIVFPLIFVVLIVSGFGQLAFGFDVRWKYKKALREGAKS